MQDFAAKEHRIHKWTNEITDNGKFSSGVNANKRAEKTVTRKSFNLYEIVRKCGGQNSYIPYKID